MEREGHFADELHPNETGAATRHFREDTRKLSEYFEKAKGVGVLATADAQGKVNLAVYSRPHFLDSNDDNTVAFIMADRLSHANIVANPHAAYSFHEDGEGYYGNWPVLYLSRGTHQVPHHHGDSHQEAAL